MEEKQLSFEEATVRLEEIVKNMENGKIPLAESLTLFEEGVSLVKLCNDMLDSAEQKVNILLKTPDGFTEADYVGEGRK
jgi:exodeoxyribonuclease VII small subunit